MKQLVFSLFTLMGCCLASGQAGALENNKQYLSSKDLSITEQGIFLIQDRAMIPLDSISFDYNAGAYYLASGVTLTRCGYCGFYTYDSQKRACYNPDCPYYPFSHK